MDRKTRITSYIAIFLLVFGSGWYTGSAYLAYSFKSNPGIVNSLGIPNDGLNSVLNTVDKTNKDGSLDIFWTVWDRLSQNYVNEKMIDKKQMIYGATKGLTASMNDPYTVFMTPDETVEFDNSLNSVLEGIGAELSVKDQMLVVVSPLKNSPAQKAGLLPGDVVYKIDGKVTGDMTLMDAIAKIRGHKGTEVNLTIIRKGKKEPFDIKIMRDAVEVDSVTMEDKGNGLYYIAINQFSDNTKTEFDQAIGNIMLKNPKGLIIDLRYNGGGYLTTSVDVLSEFIKGEQVLVKIKSRDSKNDEELKSSGSPKLPDVPMVVLINKGSASASEIVAGAIQDLKRGLILGEQSFGKGSVQEVEKLNDGSSLRMTVAKWYTPSGKSISEVGITPDQVVEFTEKDAEAGKDPQLDAAMSYLKKL